MRPSAAFPRLAAERKFNDYARFIRHGTKVLQFTWNHPANKKKRMQALIRLARFQARGRLLGKPTPARLGKYSTISAVLHRSGSAKVLYANPPDHSEMLVWRRHIQPGDLFLDVGANVGTYSIWVGELGAEIIAIEPAEDTFSLLWDNIKLNQHNITPLQVAAGAQNGFLRFTVGRDCVNRIDPRGAAEIRVLTIDSIIGDRTASGMKVDVEGFEIDVLRGSARALSDHRIRLIQLEWNGTSKLAVGTDRRPVAELLTGYGYSLYRPADDGTLVPLSDQGVGPDVFAKPNPRPSNR